MSNPWTTILAKANPNLPQEMTEIISEYLPSKRVYVTENKYFLEGAMLDYVQRHRIDEGLWYDVRKIIDDSIVDELFTHDIWVLYYTILTMRDPNNHYISAKCNMYVEPDQHVSMDVRERIKKIASAGDAREVYRLLQSHFTFEQFQMMGY